MSDNINETLSQIQTAFTELKNTNETKLAEMATKGSVDTLIETKISSINDTITELQRKMERPSIVSGVSQEEVEHKSAFEKWARKGSEGNLAEIEKKAITLHDTDASGGFLMPKVVETGIRESLRTLSPIRSRATVISVSTDDYSFLSNLRGLTTGWVGETDPRPETATPKLGVTKVPMGELYANPAASQRSLDDAAFDLAGWLEQNISDEMAIAENVAFVTGSGNNQPKGFLNTTGLTTVKTGVAGALPANGDFVTTMIYSMASAYRAGAAFYSAGASIASIRTIKDANGNYIWQPSMVLGTPSTLAGYEVVELEDMPAVAANATPLVFANMKQGYLIADRIGIRTLRDPFTNKPFVHFYATKRVGGMVQDPKAFVVLKVAV
jgi:HK97 family phage major capsid protein